MSKPPETLDAYGKLTVGESGKQEEAEVKSILTQIQTMEFSQKKTSYKVPKVVDRLLSNDDAKQRTRIRKAKGKTPRKIRGIKKPEIVIADKDDIPSAAHYEPNYSAVISNGPSLTIETNHPHKPVSLGTTTMGKMLQEWTQLRDYVFIKNDERPELNPYPSAFNQAKLSESPGIIMRECRRNKWLEHEETPGPAQYNVTIPLKQEPRQIPFNKQAPRPQPKANTAAIRDTRTNWEYVRPRAPSAIPFDKQSSREPRQKHNDAMWDEIAQEQAKLIARLAKPEVEKKKESKKREPFSLQTSSPKHPFGHLMRKEVEPKEEYQPRKPERPATAFDISQPALGKDRIVYRKSEAPDKFYDNVQGEWENTQPRAGTALEINRQEKKRGPYVHMPSGCGAGTFYNFSSTLNPTCTVNIGKMGERKLMYDSPGSMKRKMPPPPSSDL